MVILNLYGIPFHAVVVFRPEHDFLFKSASSYCAELLLLSASISAQNGRIGLQYDERIVPARFCLFVAQNHVIT